MKMLQGIIFVTNGIHPIQIGGMQKHSRLLIEELAKYKQVKVYVLHPHLLKVFDKKFENIIEIRIEGINSKNNYILEYYRYSHRVYKEIEKLPQNIPIYSQGYCVWYGIGTLGNRVTINPHGLEAFQTLSIKDYIKYTPFRLVTDYLINRSANVVSLGGKLTQILSSRLLNKSKLVVIPNAVLLQDQNPASSLGKKFTKKRVNCLFVARFAANKGIHILLEAVKQLNEEGHEDKFYFTLAGTGPLYDYFVEKWKFRNVEYLGNVDDQHLRALYAVNDVFLFPTLFEGMPTVILEAMEQCMPIICSNVGATAELVDETNGFLLESNNVGMLKQALLTFSALPENQKRSLGINSYQKIESKFNWKLVAEQSLNLLVSIKRKTKQ